MSIQKTFVAKEHEIERTWYLIDAQNLVLGRLASEVARRLRGKHKAIFTPHADTGDFIIVVNAEKVQLTGRKLDQKKYFHYSGFMGGMKETVFRKRLAQKPEELIRQAVRGMLPKNSLGRRQIKKLKIYSGGEHPHQAQQPEKLALLGA